MSETLYKMELDKLRKIAGQQLRVASSDIQRDEIHDKILDLEDELADLRDDLYHLEKGLSGKQKEQLETFLAVCKQYGHPVPDDVKALNETKGSQATKLKGLDRR